MFVVFVNHREQTNVTACVSEKTCEQAQTTNEVVLLLCHPAYSVCLLVLACVIVRVFVRALVRVAVRKTEDQTKNDEQEGVCL